MKKIILPILLLTFALTSLKLTAQEVVQITNNDIPEGDPNISGNHLVWTGSVPGDQGSRVFYYDLNEQNSPAPLTDGDLSINNLDLSGDKLVWEGASNPDDPNTLEIYYYNLSEQGPVVQLTDNVFFDRSPRISGNNVVWFGRLNSLSNAFNRIYYFDLNLLGQSEPMKLLENGKNYHLPTISGDHVAWYYGDGSDSEVVYYNLNTQGPPVQLTSTGVFVYDIQFSANKLWWRGWHNDIHYYDLDQGNSVLLYDVNPNGYSLYLDASDEFAAWSRYDIDTDSRDLFYYDLNGSNAPIQLTDDAAFDSYPVIVGNYIVWQKGEENEAEIYFYNLSTQDSVVRLTDNDFEDSVNSLSASGNAITWRGGYFMQENTGEIFMAQLPGMSTAAEELPALAYELGPVTPNPVFDEAVIEYSIQERAPVTLQILDMNGRPLKVLKDEISPAGTHQVVFQAGNLPPGVYLYSLRVNNSVTTKRLVVMSQP